MPRHVRLVHRLLVGRYHVYTSPDLEGLHVTADTQEDARDAVIQVLDAIASERGEPVPSHEFLAPAAAA
jgi:predicted RNase H-like HicB family nuclease